jgi:hypothetical protein
MTSRSETAWRRLVMYIHGHLAPSRTVTDTTLKGDLQQTQSAFDSQHTVVKARSSTWCFEYSACSVHTLKHTSINSARIGLFSASMHGFKPGEGFITLQCSNIHGLVCVGTTLKGDLQQTQSAFDCQHTVKKAQSSTWCFEYSACSVHTLKQTSISSARIGLRSASMHGFRPGRGFITLQCSNIHGQVVVGVCLCVSAFVRTPEHGCIRITTNRPLASLFIRLSVEYG